MAAVRCRRPLHPSLYDRLERQTEHLLGQEPQQRRGRRALAVSGQSRARRRRGNARAPAQIVRGFKTTVLPENEAFAGVNRGFGTLQGERLLSRTDRRERSAAVGAFERAGPGTQRRNRRRRCMARILGRHLTHHERTSSETAADTGMPGCRREPRIWRTRSHLLSHAREGSIPQLVRAKAFRLSLCRIVALRQ
jgi:hypothetical protein